MGVCNNALTCPVSRARTTQAKHNPGLQDQREDETKSMGSRQWRSFAAFSGVFLIVVSCSVALSEDPPDAEKAKDNCGPWAAQPSLLRLGKLSEAQFRTSLRKIALLQLGGDGSLSSPADHAVLQMLAAMHGARCKDQAEVPCVQEQLPAVPPDQRVFIASDLINSARLMPHFVTQMLFTAAILPPGAVFVSVYESGSSDATGGHFML